MINDKNIRAVNKHIRHLESMDNAIKFETISFKKSKTPEGKSSASKWRKLFKKWKQFSKNKITKIHLTQKCNYKDLSLDYDKSLMEFMIAPLLELLFREINDLKAQLMKLIVKQS